jgi:hypothetical protein
MSTHIDALRREMMAAGRRLLGALSLEERLSLLAPTDPTNAALTAQWLASRKTVDDLALGYTQSISRYRESMAAAVDRVYRKK